MWRLKLWSGLWICGLVGLFFNLKQLSLLSFLMKTCFLMVETVCEALVCTLLSLWTQSLNCWRQKWTWGCGCMKASSPVYISPCLQQGHVSFLSSSPCFLITTLHLQHLCWLFFCPSYGISFTCSASGLSQLLMMCMFSSSPSPGHDFYTFWVEVLVWRPLTKYWKAVSMVLLFRLAFEEPVIPSHEAHQAWNELYT